MRVSAPTLYWHVKDKRHAARPGGRCAHRGAAAAAAARARAAWHEWLREVGEAQYRALIGHRDAGLVVAGNRPPPDSLPQVERLVTSITGAGFPPDEALEVLPVLATS